MALFEIRNLTFTYPDQEKPALTDLNFSLKQGEFLVVCGKSGCGKSTLLRHFKTAMAPYGERKGQILFEGRELDAVSVREQGARIGYVLQSPDNQLVTDKVWHELAFGLENLGYETGTIRLRVAEMASFFGIQTWFEKNVEELSGGQKQRIAIARALATNPKVLLCDEATSALDPNTTHAILQLIQKINREMGITVVIITHQMSVVEDVCSHVAILDNGTVVEQGSVRDIFSNPHSDAAKRLVFPAGTPERELLPGRKMVRVAFNGTQTTDKPLVASLAIECGALVSIVAADTRVVNGQTLGSMLLALPEDEHAEAALEYIKNYPGITYEEVNN